MVEGIFFYIFAFTAIFSSLMVISLKNPVHAVLWLIFTFFNAAGLFLLIGAEFLAMLLVVVYVGAVAVLFLFVIMMLDINLDKIREGFLKRFILGCTISGILLFDLISLILASTKRTVVISRSDYMTPDQQITNTHAIGELLYTDFALHFQIAGLILFTAMIGCIVLTLRAGKGVRRQDANIQQMRNKSTSIAIVQVNKGEGV